MTTASDTTAKNTSAFYLQAAASFGVALFTMLAASVGPSTSMYLR